MGGIESRERRRVGVLDDSMESTHGARKTRSEVIVSLRSFTMKRAGALRIILIIMFQC